jgi:hypothetical protein
VLFTFFFVGGALGVSFLVVPTDQVMVRTVLYILAQGIILADFFLLDTYGPEIFSTDVRNFAFSILDCTSKVQYYRRLQHSQLLTNSPMYFITISN